MPSFKNKIIYKIFNFNNLLKNYIKGKKNPSFYIIIYYNIV